MDDFDPTSIGAVAVAEPEFDPTSIGAVPVQQEEFDPQSIGAVPVDAPTGEGLIGPRAPLTTKQKGAFLREKLAGTFLDQTPESLAALDVAGNARTGIDAQAASGISPGRINFDVIKKVPEFLVSELRRSGGIEPTEILDKHGEPVKLAPGEDTSTQPIITLPKPTGQTIAAGIGRGLATAAETLSTPENLEIMGLLAGAPAVIQKVVAAGFGAAMTKSAGERVGDLVDRWDQMSPSERSETITSIGAEAVFAALAAKHATGEARLSPTERATLAEAERIKGASAPPADEHPAGTIIDTGEGFGRYVKQANGQWKEIDERGYVVADSKVSGTPKGEVVYQPSEPAAEPRVTEPVAGEEAAISAPPEEPAPSNIESPVPAGADLSKGVGANLGPGAANIEEFPAQQTTGLKRAVVDTERLARGAEPIPTVERQREDGVVQAAEDKLDTQEGQIEKDALISRIVDEGDKAISEHDAATLLVERARLMNERGEWEERIGRGEQVAQGKERIAEIGNELDRLDHAQRAAGSTWGRLGHMYQRLIREDYTLDALIQKDSAARGRPLEPEEKAALEAKANEIKVAQEEADRITDADKHTQEDEGVRSMIEATINELGKKYLEDPETGRPFDSRITQIAERIVKGLESKSDEALKRIRARRAEGRLNALPVEDLVDYSIVGAAKIARKGFDFAKWSAEMIRDIGDMSEEVLREVWDASNARLDQLGSKNGADSEKVTRALKTKKESTQVEVAARAKAEATAGEPLSQKTVYDLVRSLITEGIHGEDALMQAAHEKLKEFYPELTERDVRRAYVKYGREIKHPSRDVIDKEIAELNSLVKIQEDIDRLRENEDPWKSQDRPEVTQLIRDKIKQRNELLKKYEGKASQDRLASRDEAKQTALRNAIEDLDRQLRTGEKPVKGEPAPDSVQTEQLRAERDAMKAKLKEIEDASNPGKSEEQSKLEAMEKRRDALLDKFNRGDISTTGKKAGALTSEQADVQAQIDTINSQIADLRKDARDSANLPKTAAEKQVEQLAKIRDRLDETLSGKRPANAAKDWTPLSAAAADLKAEIHAMQELATQMKRDAKPTRDPAAVKEQAQIKALEKSIKNYEDKLAAGNFMTKSRTQGPDSAKVAALKAIRDARVEAYQAAKKAGKPVLSPDERYNATRLKQVEKRIGELQAKISAKDFTKTPRRPAPQKNQTVLDAEAKVAKLKLEVDRGIKQSELARRGRVERTLDGIVKWNRALILSGYHTLFKLSSAAVEIMALAPIEEAAGGVISKLAPGIAEKAPRHGGFSGKAEVEAVVGTWKNLLRDAASEFKTGHTDLDLLYGKPDIMPKELKDYIGHIHGALKSPAKRNEFIRSFEKRVAYAEKNGVDVRDPMVQTRLSAEAYKDANRSIFREDNMVSNMWNRALSATRAVNKSTGQPSLRGKAVESALKFSLPIVRIPTNIVSRTFEYSLGSVSGAARTVRALTNGLENLHPDEADAIMRNFKRGAVGAGLMLYGYFNADKIGGYYQPGEKRKDSDVKAGRVRIFGFDVPSFLIHNPALEQLQIGATIRRVADSRLKKSDKETQGLTAGIVAAALGLAEETPFVGEMLQKAKIFNPHERRSVVGEMAREAIPQFVQQVAKDTDKDAKGERVKRVPNSIVDELKLGVPGLRKQVSVKKSR